MRREGGAARPRLKSPWPRERVKVPDNKKSTGSMLEDPTNVVALGMVGGKAMLELFCSVGETAMLRRRETRRSGFVGLPSRFGPPGPGTLAP